MPIDRDYLLIAGECSGTIPAHTHTHAHTLTSVSSCNFFLAMGGGSIGATIGVLGASYRQKPLIINGLWMALNGAVIMSSFTGGKGVAGVFLTHRYIHTQTHTHTHTHTYIYIYIYTSIHKSFHSYI